jgi:hypothetical protein
MATHAALTLRPSPARAAPLSSAESATFPARAAHVPDTDAQERPERSFSVSRATHQVLAVGEEVLGVVLAIAIALLAITIGLVALCYQLVYRSLALGARFIRSF